MRARVTIRGLVPLSGSGRDAREGEVIPWEVLDCVGARFILRDRSGRVARIGGERVCIPISRLREQRVAGRAWRRAIERAWREGSIEHVARSDADAWCARFMGVWIAAVVGFAAWIIVPQMVWAVWGERAGVSSWMVVAEILLVVCVIGGMMLPMVIFAVLLWDVRCVWTRSLPRVIRMTREGLSCTDGLGRERAYAWADCERVRMGFGGTLWFRGGERVTLMGLGGKGRRMLGWVREEIGAGGRRTGRRLGRRSMFVALLVVLCVLNGVSAAVSGAMIGAGTGAVPWGHVAAWFAKGASLPSALLVALLYGGRISNWWKQRRKLARRREAS